MEGNNFVKRGHNIGRQSGSVKNTNVVEEISTGNTNGFRGGRGTDDALQVSRRVSEEVLRGKAKGE